MLKYAIYQSIFIPPTVLYNVIEYGLEKSASKEKLQF